MHVNAMNINVQCAVLAILTYRKYVAVAVLRAPSLTPARYAFFPNNPFI